MKRFLTISMVVAAGLILQQLLMVAVAQEERPELAVGRVPGTQAAAGASANAWT